MSAETAIRASHVTKLYRLYDKPSDRLRESLGLTRKKRSREHYALTDVSFDIARGETVGIIGTNGAGKSTILKIITGVLSPTEGEVTVNGRISALLELGAGFNMEYSGIENVYLNGTMMGFSEEEIDARLKDILAFADIGEYAKQPVKLYSSGMFVRLAFAVAINIDPEILIVDEALSVGDVFFQAKCYRKFEEFKKEGRTILFVSHDLNSISRYCDRVILLDHGKVVDSGRPKEMVDLYKQILVNQAPAAAKRGSQAEAGQPVPTGETGQAGQGQPASAAETGQDGQLQSASPPEMPQDGQGWRTPAQMNPNVLDYGDGRAKMEGILLLDENGLPTNTIEKGASFTIKVKVHYYEDIEDPIFAYTIRDMRGTEITGTNTMYERVTVEPRKAGDTDIVSYTQRVDLQGGEYLISFGLTGYREGDFTVYHRLYDACSLVVVSSKNTVGFYDMNSVITVERTGGRTAGNGEA